MAGRARAVQPLVISNHLYQEQHYRGVVPLGQIKKDRSKLMLCSFVRSCATNSFPLASGPSVCSNSKKGNTIDLEKPGGPQKSWRALQPHQRAQHEKTHHPNNPISSQGCWVSCHLQLSPGPRDGLASLAWEEAALCHWGCSRASLALLWLLSTSLPMLGLMHRLQLHPVFAFLSVSHFSWDQHASLLGSDLTALRKAV